MGLKLTNLDEARRYVRKYESAQRKKIINRLQFCANKFVVYARTKTRQEGQFSNVKPANASSPGFFDWTANLRSSIGYIIVYNGQVVNSDFESAGGQEGVSEAKTFASSLIPQIPPNTYAVICVAGMNYAAYVEAKGYDVITGGSILLTNELKKFF